MSDVSHLSPFFISAIFLRETKHETAYNENAIPIFLGNSANTDLIRQAKGVPELALETLETNKAIPILPIGIGPWVRLIDAKGVDVAQPIWLRDCPT